MAWRTAELCRSYASIIAVGSSRRSLNRSCNNLRIAFIQGCSSGGTLSNDWKIVSDALRYHDSGSRTDSNTNASGLAADSSGQNEQPGQSTRAT